jgi:ABC-type nickel/cobalt efflux system permease component RcnA
MKNLNKLSVALMLALGTTFAMTSCGGAAEADAHTDAAAHTEEAHAEEAHAEEAHAEEAHTEEVADSTATCEGGEEMEEATCEGGEATEEEAAH